MLKRYLQNSTAAFARNDDGTIAVMFGVMCVAMVGVLGLAVDGGRAMGAQAKADSALDAAALAATRALFTSNMDDSEIEAYARSFFQSNISGDGDLGAAYDALEVTINRNTKTIRLAVNTRVPTTFGRMLGIDSIKFSADSVATFNVRDIELAMALDLTGSMCQPCSKIADLKDATTNLIDTLIPDAGALSDVRISLVPYSASVNAGPLAAAATDAVSIDDCVVERTGGHAFKDTAPGPGKYFDARTPATPVNDIDLYQGTATYTCPSAEVLPLTDQKNLLKTTVSGYSTGGWTAGHLGAAWAWYMLSDKWSGVVPGGSEPGAYGKANLIKAVVFMTDGEFNTAWKNGSSRNQAETLCDNMKSEGVIVYTVSFNSPNHPTLLTCASTDPDTGNPLYYDADNGADLNAAFQDIAIKLTALRLAQ